MTATATQQTGTKAREEFSGNQLEVIAETAATAVAAQARAQVEARYIMALKRPRNMDQARMLLLKECARPSSADAFWYTKPIGKGVSGLSVRFAEAAVRCLTNLYPETPTVYEDEKKRILRVSVTDLELNVTYSKDLTIAKTVERRSVKDGQEVIGQRLNSRGDTVYLVAATEDDLLNKENALVSKALRTLILRLVPGGLADECEEVIRSTLANKTAADPDAARKKLLDAFAGVGVTPADLKEYLGHDVGQLVPAEIDELRGYFAAIRDGETTWKAVMDAKKGAAETPAAEAPGKGATGLKDALRKKKPAAAAPASAPATSATPAPTPPADYEDAGDGPPSEEEMAEGNGRA